MSRYRDDAELVWTFETAAFRIECLMRPDEYVDISYDDTNETRENLESGFWRAFSTEVRVIHKATEVTMGYDCLGGSIYENPTDFLKEHRGARGSYFTDMVREAIALTRQMRREIAEPALRAA